MLDHFREVHEYLVANGKYEFLWPFASGGKKPLGTKYSEITDINLRLKLKDEVECMRRDSGKEFIVT